ncbi:MAG: MFS transporter [Comamonadaceae bacterium]|nr:MAG: MFS transporter [Comamonadaceae bacterium]
MLMVLTSAFALSQAFRTVASIMAEPLRAEFGFGAQGLGLFAGAFHFAFGALQLFMGIGIDLHGVRRTVLAVFPLAIAGSAMSAMAPDAHWLLFGQILIGIGCAPAFLVCTVFIGRHFASGRFAAVSAITMAVGSVGMLATGTPLAWLVAHVSWRAGFVALAAGSALSWLAIFRLVREPERASGAGMPPRPGVMDALRGCAALIRMPHTPGILALSAVTYAAFLSLRGLWLAPLLIARHDFSLVQSGHVALALSALGMLGLPLFGALDPGPARRRATILAFTLASAALFAGMAFGLGAVFDVVASIAIGVLSGFIVLQYADVKAAYPAAMTGRAMALFTMAMFLGVALMQWTTGLFAAVAAAHGVELHAAAMGLIAVLLVAAALAFRLLPAPPR